MYKMCQKLYLDAGYSDEMSKVEARWAYAEAVKQWAKDLTTYLMSCLRLSVHIKMHEHRFTPMFHVMNYYHPVTTPHHPHTMHT